MHLKIMFLTALAASANSASVQKQYNVNISDPKDVPIEIDHAVTEEPVNKLKNYDRSFETTRNSIKEMITPITIKPTSIVLQRSPAISRLLPSKENPEKFPSNYPMDSVQSQSGYKTQEIVLTNQYEDVSKSDEDKSSEYFPQKQQFTCENQRSCKNQNEDTIDTQYQRKQQLHTSVAQSINEQNNTNLKEVNQNQQDYTSINKDTEYKPITIIEPPKIPRRNFSLKYEKNIDDPESRYETPSQVNGSIFINKLRDSGYSKSSSVNTDYTKDQVNSQSQGSQSSMPQQSPVQVENARPNLDQGSRPSQRPEKSQNPAASQSKDTNPYQGKQGSDDMWVWGVEKPKQNKTDTVGLDHRAAFSGDKCATGMVRFAGKCVETD